MIELVKESVSTLNDFTDKLDIFFNYSVIKININDQFFPLEIYNFLQNVNVLLKEKVNITAEEFKALINDLKSKNKLSINFWKPLRIALTGQEHGPDIGKVVEILGRDVSLQGIKIFLKKNAH